MTVKLKNNVQSTLRTEVLSSSTTILLPVGHGARFPTLGVGEYFYATIEDAAGNYEIVQATARVTDTLTVTRGAEGTTARTFAAGSTIEMRVTAAGVLDAAQDAAQALVLGDFGITASVAELNILDGVTATTAEINILDGVTTTAAELNVLDGIPGTLTATELGYVDGVTSAIQTQIDSKQATITGAATTITASNLTASRAVVSDGSGKVAVATTTSAEIGYLNGVTSAIQTQLDAKLALDISGNLRVNTIVDAAGARGPNFSKAYVETVFALTGTTPALNPANGGIQTWTLTANSTPTDGVQAGESITLLIDDGTAFTVTWPSVTWKTNGGVAPTLLTTGLTVIVLWKVGSVLYGARVGDA